MKRVGGKEMNSGQEQKGNDWRREGSEAGGQKGESLVESKED